MSTICNELQEKLASEPRSLLSPDEQEHMSACSDCSRMLVALGELSGAFKKMPAMDAPQVIVDQLLATVLHDPEAGAVHRVVAGGDRLRRLASDTKAFLLFLLRPQFALPLTALAALLFLLMPGMDGMQRQATMPVPAAPPSREDPASIDSLTSDVSSVNVVNDHDASTNVLWVSDDNLAEEQDGSSDAKARGHVTTPLPTAPREGRLAAAAEVKEESRRALDPVLDAKDSPQAQPGEVGEKLQKDTLKNDYEELLKVRKKAAVEALDGQTADRLESGRADKPMAVAGGVAAGAETLARAGRLEAGGGGGFADKRDTTTSVQRFWRERSIVDGLPSIDATGYWSNTYLPGDPSIRLLQSRLTSGDRAALQAYATTPLRLDDAVRQIAEPFDAPRDAALSLFVQPDRQAVQGPTRMLVQVGLQATKRFSGRRPAMNVGLVVDLRGEIPVDVAARVRALVMAFAQAKEPDDRFSVTVAGKPGAMIVKASDFKHGFLTVALDRLFNQATPGAEVLDLPSALATAQQVVATADDPDAPLGSSLIVLATSQPLGEATAAIRAAAHRSAVAGVPFSVVGIGNRVQLDEIDSIALAGQGNRRLLGVGSEATQLVDRELSAIGRAVARAVRLSIRLQPGVKLVDVIGARRLDENHAQQVREAEQSIDQRTARNLGVQADRGDDEEGIQIVIPTFYSGDAHTILLDVVAPASGPLVEVTAKYKDLVQVRNGSARAGVSLDRGTTPQGPLERNVLKNFLALRLSATLKQAGESLAANDDAAALSTVTDFLELLQGLQTDLPEFQKDADIAGDIALMNEYLALLHSGATAQPQPRAYLATSMQLAGRLKVMRRP